MIIPTSGRLVLQKIKEDEPVSRSGLILPSSQPKQDRYRVVSLDSSRNKVHVGRVVYIDKYKGVEITHDEEKYLVVNDEDIIAYEST